MAYDEQDGDNPASEKENSDEDILKDARDALKECIDEDPSRSEVYYYVGLSLEAMGKKQEAMIFLQRISQGQDISQTPVFRMQDIDVQIF